MSLATWWIRYSWRKNDAKRDAGLSTPEDIFRVFISNEEVLAFSGPLMQLAARTFLMTAVNGAFDSVTTGTGFANLKMVA